MKRVNKFIIISSLLVIGLLSALFIYRNHTKTQWEAVRYGKSVDAIYGLGTVHSDQVFKLSVGVANFVKKIYVKTGDTVHKNQKLVLYNDGRLVRAPFSGTITARPFFSNQVANPNSTILTLTNLQNLYLLVSMDQNSLLHLNNSKNVIISFDALAKQKFSGTIQSIYSNDGSFYLRVVPNRLPAIILPGMTADVAIVTKTNAPSVQIPIKSISAGKVTYKENHSEKTVKVKIGTVADGWGQLLSANIPKNAKVLLRS